jgi:hypothetical protein
MKTKYRRLFIALALLALATLNSQLSTVFAQGSLTPPGVPGPTMKSLDQIEARTAITNTSTLVTITQSGSYYLTHNITVTAGDAIDITTNGVTLDLNGFTLTSTEASPTGTGILLLGNGISDITIRNGHIRGGVTLSGPFSTVYTGSGFANGIALSVANASANVLVSGVSVMGCLVDGINLGNSATTVESCKVYTVGNYGIVANNIYNSSSDQFGNQGIFAFVIANNCSANTDSGTGNALQAQTAINCTGINNSTVGNAGGVDAYAAINCFGESYGSVGVAAYTANNCYGNSLFNTGLAASQTATGCYGIAYIYGSGLSAVTANNCYGATKSKPKPAELDCMPPRRMAAMELAKLELDCLPPRRITAMELADTLEIPAPATACMRARLPPDLSASRMAAARGCGVTISPSAAMASAPPASASGPISSTVALAPALRPTITITNTTCRKEWMRHLEYKT